MPEPPPAAPAFEQWLDSPLGEQVLKVEQDVFSEWLCRMFGYHILQLGCSEAHSLILDSPVGHKIQFAPRYHKGVRQAVADNEELPLASDSMDVVVIHHALDFTDDSHRLLREAVRVLRPGGHLLVVGFNPLSGWGLVRGLSRRRAAPWNARFLHLRRVTDWLKLLDLHVEQVRFGLHFLPLTYARMLRNAQRIEAFGNRLSSPLGGIYFIQGVKQVAPFIPIVPRWRPLRTATTGMPAAENLRTKLH